MPDGPQQPQLRLSVVAPAHNEEENVALLVEEVGKSGLALAERFPEVFTGDLADWFEFVLVDDGSTDSTRSLAQSMQADNPWLRIVAMTNTPKGSGNGQSAAFHAGFRQARGRLIAVLDADLQNDPMDLVEMFALMQKTQADMVQGDRSANRRDSIVRRVGSRVGRLFRGLILGDTIRDTGCSLRLMTKEVALGVPLQFKGMHRFIPVTARHLGFTVVEMPVNHRERHAGTPKYGMGITKRAIPGLIDCFAVRWMRGRRRPVSCEVFEPTSSESQG